LEWRDVRDEGAGAGAALDPAFGVQLVVGGLGDGPGDGQLPGEVAGGRKTVAGLQAAVEDGSPELFGELQVQRQGGGPVNGQR
jgi:hypothetical protein